MSRIHLQDVNLIFRTKREHRLKDVLIPKMGKFSQFGQDGTVHALKNITLDVNDGDRLAIIGHNGAGKTTLLKLMNGIYPVSSGCAEINGRVAGLFEFSTGFEMELSGWDNIYIRGIMLGETPHSIMKKMKSIAEFSELGDFLDMPVKYYSSGMFIRLAFSVSTAVEPEILLLDEAIGAGDAGFLDKARQRMGELVEKSNIMVLVTHSMDSALQMCNRCIWMEQGSIVMEGKPDEIVPIYLQRSLNH